MSRTRKSRTRTALVVAASVAAALSLAAPAQAEQKTFADKRGDLKGGLDVQNVRVTNNGPWVMFRTKHRNLRYSSAVPGGSVSHYIDTIPGRKGPEFHLAAPVGFDGGISISKSRLWKDIGPGMGLGCRIRFNANYKADTVWFAVRRVCLANAYLRKVGKLRVSTHAIQHRNGHDSDHDWAPRYHRFHPAVRKG